MGRTWQERKVKQLVGLGSSGLFLWAAGNNYRDLNRRMANSVMPFRKLSGVMRRVDERRDRTGRGACCRNPCDSLNFKGSCWETTDRGNTEEAGLWPHPGPNYSSFVPLWYIC